MAIQVAKSSKDVIKEIDILTNLTPPKPHNVPNDVLNLIYDIDNAADIIKSDFFNRVVNLSTTELGAPNKIQNVFATFDPPKKDEFFRHFGNRLANPNHADSIDDLDFWKKMNQTEIDTFTGSPTPVEAARMKIWCDTPSIYRGSDVIGDVKVLDELIKLKHTDPKAIDHLFYYKNRPTSGDAMTDVHVTGGHKLQLAFSGSNSHIIVNNGIEILDPNFIHFPVDPSTGLQIIPPNTTNNMIKYINNTNNMGYRTVPRVDGHIDHRNILIKKDPQPIHQYQSNEYVLNGIVYEKKKLHTQIRSDWDENDIIYQLSYALANKIRRPSKDWIMHNAHNTNDTAIIKAYVGTLINGYKVHIHHANFHRYNLGSIFFDSYTSFKFLKFKTI